MPDGTVQSESIAQDISRPVGRTLRFLLGVWLVADQFSYYGSASWGAILITAGWIVAMLALYGSIHLVVWTYLSSLNRYIGASLALAPGILLYVFGGAPGRAAILSYIGVSLILAAVRADPGCEVMSIPGLVSKKHTHLACILFSPIDWLERRIIRQAGRRA